MLSLLPDFADPVRLCALGKVYDGKVPLAELPRLAPLLTSTEGEAAFVLAFELDADRRPVVMVKVKANLALQCQRCLGTLRQAVDVESRLAVVAGPDEAERLPDDVDPLLVSEGRLELRSLIEDELILAVPAAPTHRPADCAVSLPKVSRAGPAEDHSASEEAVHPFAALANWKSDSKNQD